MNRTQALKTISGSLFITGTQLPETTAFSTDSAFLNDFLPRWKTALSYSLKVLDKMPAELYSYKPTPAQMTFGKQYTHVGHWNTFFIGNIVGQSALAEPTQMDKATVKEYYTRCHQHCTKILENLDENLLDKTGFGDNDYWKKHSGRDFLLRAFMHVAHHRAETLVYLRLNGIEPPFFEF